MSVDQRDINEIWLAVESLISRIDKLEKDSHPPVNRKELIQSNIARIEAIERRK